VCACVRVRVRPHVRTQLWICMCQIPKSGLQTLHYNWQRYQTVEVLNYYNVQYLVSRHDQYVLSAAVCKEAELKLSYFLTMVQNNSWILLYNNFAASKTTEKTLKWNAPWYASDTTTQSVKDIQINISESIQIPWIQMAPQILAVINTNETNTITSPSAVLSTTVLNTRLEN